MRTLSPDMHDIINDDVYYALGQQLAITINTYVMLGVL